jgi:hypothetical protein
LGLGWDPDWPEERIEKITLAYRVEMEKFRASFLPLRERISPKHNGSGHVCDLAALVFAMPQNVHVYSG